MAAPFPLPQGITKWHSTSYPAIDPSRPELNAKGKVVVVFGGGSGIGAAIVKAFAAAGASNIAIFGCRQNVLETSKANICDLRRKLGITKYKLALHSFTNI
jgi:short-subunit dehydrogenase involved in D-alanine esterification of teichoic acids